MNLKLNFFIIIFLFSLSSLANSNYWLGGGVMSYAKNDYRHSNNSSTLVVWGLGYGFANLNLLFFEAGYGLPIKLYDEATSRTSFVKLGYERYFTIGGLFPYLGLALGGIVRTIEAKKRSTNWQVGGEDYDVQGDKKRSSVTSLYEATIGVRFLNNFIKNVSLDWNMLSVGRSNNSYKYMTYLTLVYISGD